VYLIEHGYAVTSNEIDPYLTKIAGQYASNADHHVVLDLRDCYWQSLVEKMPGNRTFNAVLVLGNSICLVLEQEQRKQCVEQFFSILKPGGMLIIDERNFTYIFENAQNIQNDRCKNFSCSWRIMYCGQSVRGCPWEISRDKIIWRIYNNMPPVRNDEDIEKGCIDDLDLYPFKQGELENLLKEVGFKDIKVFSDLKLGNEPNCDFFTYTAIKPLQTTSSTSTARSMQISISK